MDVLARGYSVQFSLLTNNEPHWNYVPAVGSPDLALTHCQITADSHFDFMMTVFTIQPLSTEPIIFRTASDAIVWTDPTNDNEPTSQPAGITKVYSSDSKTLYILDENSASGSFGFTFQIIFSGQTFTSSDPIIVNKDTSGNVPVYPLSQAADETREVIAGARTTES